MLAMVTNDNLNFVAIITKMTAASIAAEHVAKKII